MRTTFPMNHPSRLVFVALITLLAATDLSQAGNFEYSINLYDDNYDQYLHSATDAEVYTELVAGHSTFWKPSSINVWGEVIYRFPLDFTITSASLTTEIVSFVTLDSGAEAYLDVSEDGSNWTTILQSLAGQGGFKTSPGDITGIVEGSNEIWIRARLLSTVNWPTDGSIFAQFIRTNPGWESVANGGPSRLAISATGVPEPTSLAISFVAIGFLLCRQRTKD